MCEVCRDPLLDTEKVEPIHPAGEGDDSWLCLFHEEHAPEPVLCGLPATSCVHFNYVEEHLCETHKKLRAEERSDEGLKEFLQMAGFGGEESLVAFKDRARCEYAPELGPGPECGRPAHWALVVPATMEFCEEHLRAYHEEKEQKARDRRGKAGGGHSRG